MTSRRTGHLKDGVFPLALALSLATLPACNPYQNFDGEYYAGPIDPTNFAAPYVGQLAGTADQQGGVIAASSATAAGNPVIYYSFPFSDGQNSQADPLAVATDSAPAGKAYVFDPAAASAFPATAKCVAPKNYKFDQRTEAYRKDEQGVIFSVIPTSGSYVPVVMEDPVTSNGEKCQDIKSKKTVLTRKDVTVAPNPNGKFDAFAVIDPGADVQPSGANGLGPFHLGWYNQYMVGFIDGGYVPTEDVPMMNTTPAYTRMVPQTLYAPIQIPGLDATGMTMVPVKGGVGTGYDILDAARGDTGYSPVCHVLAYQPDDPLNPKTSAADLSQAELASAGAADADKGFIFCFQPF